MPSTVGRVAHAGPVDTPGPFAWLSDHPGDRRPAAAAPAPTERMHVVFIAQRRDCIGNLGMAGVLQRPRLAERIASRTILVAGPATDTVDIRPLLPPAIRQADIRPIATSERQWLRTAGHSATPVLLVFDADRRLRLTAPVADDPASHVAFVRTLTHLLTNDPTH
jgi:hypothetical protein